MSYFQGGLFASKAPTFGTSTATSSAGFSFGGAPSQGSGLFAKPFSTPGFGTGFNTATTSTGFGGKCCLDLYLSHLVRKPAMWCLNRSDANQAVQSQKIARSMKIQIYEEVGLYYPSSKKKRH